MTKNYLNKEKEKRLIVEKNLFIDFIKKFTPDASIQGVQMTIISKKITAKFYSRKYKLRGQVSYGIGDTQLNANLNMRNPLTLLTMLKSFFFLRKKKPELLLDFQEIRRQDNSVHKLVISDEKRSKNFYGAFAAIFQINRPQKSEAKKSGVKILLTKKDIKDIIYQISPKNSEFRLECWDDNFYGITIYEKSNYSEPLTRRNSISFPLKIRFKKLFSETQLFNSLALKAILRANYNCNNGSIYLIDEKTLLLCFKKDNITCDYLLGA